MDRNKPELDYDRINRLKPKLLKCGAVSVLATIICFALAHIHPFVYWAAGKIFSTRPLLSAVQIFAKQSQSRGIYATAVRMDDTLATGCEKAFPVSNPAADMPFRLPVPFHITDHITPQMTLTEFIVSSHRDVVCVTLAELRHTEHVVNQPKYLAIFGSIPDPDHVEAGLRMSTVKYDLSGAHLERIDKQGTEPDLRNFFFTAPRSYAVSQQMAAAKFYTNAEQLYRDYLQEVRKNFKRPQELVIGCLYLLLSLAIGGISISYKAPYFMFLEYQKDMRAQRRPVAKLRYFLAAADVMELQKLVEAQWKTMAKKERKQREAEIQELKRLERESLPPAPSVQFETPEQKERRRQQKIATFCSQLQRITPAEHAGESERICLLAGELAMTDFESARDLLTRAIEQRRQLNLVAEKVPPGQENATA